MCKIVCVTKTMNLLAVRNFVKFNFERNFAQGIIHSY